MNPRTVTVLAARQDSSDENHRAGRTNLPARHHLKRCWRAAAWYRWAAGALYRPTGTFRGPETASEECLEIYAGSTCLCVLVCVLVRVCFVIIGFIRRLYPLLLLD